MGIPLWGKGLSLWTHAKSSSSSSPFSSSSSSLRVSNKLKKRVRKDPPPCSLSGSSLPADGAREGPGERKGEGGAEPLCYAEPMPDLPCTQLALDKLTMRLVGSAPTRALLRVAPFSSFTPLHFASPVLLCPPLGPAVPPSWPCIPPPLQAFQEDSKGGKRNGGGISGGEERAEGGKGRWFVDFLLQQNVLLEQHGEERPAAKGAENSRGSMNRAEKKKKRREAAELLDQREKDLLDPRAFTLKFLETLAVAPMEEGPDMLVLSPASRPAVPGRWEASAEGGGFLPCRMERVYTRDALAIPPFTSSRSHLGRREERLGLRSVVLCCGRMREGLDEEAVEEFLSLDPSKLLEAWLMDLSKENRAYIGKGYQAAFHSESEMVLLANQEAKRAMEEGSSGGGGSGEAGTMRGSAGGGGEGHNPASLFTQREAKRFIRFLQEEKEAREVGWGGGGENSDVDGVEVAAEDLSPALDGISTPPPPPPPPDLTYLSHAFAKRDVARLFRRLHLLRALLLDLLPSRSVPASGTTAGASKVKQTTHLNFLEAAFPALHRFYDAYCWRGPVANCTTLEKYQNLPPATTWVSTCVCACFLSVRRERAGPIELNTSHIRGGCIHR